MTHALLWCPLHLTQWQAVCFGTEIECWLAAQSLPPGAGYASIRRIK